MNSPKGETYLPQIVGTRYASLKLGVSVATLTRRIELGQMQSLGRAGDSANAAHLFDKAYIDALAAHPAGKAVKA